MYEENDMSMPEDAEIVEVMTEVNALDEVNVLDKLDELDELDDWVVEVAGADDFEVR
jgi:hypothetical protein